MSCLRNVLLLLVLSVGYQSSLLLVCLRKALLIGPANPGELSTIKVQESKQSLFCVRVLLTCSISEYVSRINSEGR